MDMATTHVFLQLFQRFGQQDRDRFARLSGERGKQAFLFGRQVKRCCFHSLKVPR
jgi:hypothetical protein